jgi:hypothetical protein
MIMQFTTNAVVRRAEIFLASIVIAGTFGFGVASFGGHVQESTAGRALVMARPVENLGLRAREPMVVEHPDGTLFVSGYGEPSPSSGKAATAARVGHWLR